MRHVDGGRASALQTSRWTCRRPRAMISRGRSSGTKSSVTRLPIGSSPGKYCRAIVWLMIITQRPIGGVVRAEVAALQQRDPQRGEEGPGHGEVVGHLRRGLESLAERSGRRRRGTSLDQERHGQRWSRMAAMLAAPTASTPGTACSLS